MHHVSKYSIHINTSIHETHDNVAKILHQKQRQRFEDFLFEKVACYKYSPSAVVATKTCRIYWNKTITTERTITNNRLDIVIIDMTNNTTYLVDVEVSPTENFKQKQT